MNFEDFKGQFHARRALEVALVGNHSMGIVGNPRTGKTTFVNIAQDMNNLTASNVEISECSACFCGNYLSKQKECTCPKELIDTYKVLFWTSRTQMKVYFPYVPIEQMTDKRKGESNEVIAERVKQAKEHKANMGKYVVDPISQNLLALAYEKLSYDGHDYNNVLSVAISIALLSVTESSDGFTLYIQPQHMAESIQYSRIEY